MLQQLHQFDPTALFNADYKREVAEGARRVAARGLPAPAPGLTPYLLLAPGLLWLALFFLVPLGFLGNQSLETRHVRLRLLVQLGLAQLLGRDHELPDAARPLVRVRGDRDRDRARSSLSARVLDRLPRRALEEPLAARDHRAVLRHLPDPHARLGDDPRRPGARRRHPPRPAHPRPDGPPARHARPRSSPASPTTSSPSWRCRSTSRSSRSTRG